jgi:hypothetical protein
MDAVCLAPNGILQTSRSAKGQWLPRCVMLLTTSRNHRVGYHRTVIDEHSRDSHVRSLNVQGSDKVDDVLLSARCLSHQLRNRYGFVEQIPRPRQLLKTCRLSRTSLEGGSRKRTVSPAMLGRDRLYNRVVVTNGHLDHSMELCGASCYIYWLTLPACPLM